MNRSERIAKEIDDAKKEFEKVRVTNEELREVVMELQTQVNKILKWKKYGILCFSVILCVLFFRMF